MSNNQTKDPFKVSDEHINPAMLQIILDRADISPEKLKGFFEEDEED